MRFISDVRRTLYAFTFFPKTKKRENLQHGIKIAVSHSRKNTKLKMPRFFSISSAHNTHKFVGRRNGVYFNSYFCRCPGVHIVFIFGTWMPSISTNRHSRHCLLHFCPRKARTDFNPVGRWTILNFTRQFIGRSRAYTRKKCPSEQYSKTQCPFAMQTDYLF